MSNRKSIITLLVVAIVCSVILSSVYALTESRISETGNNVTLNNLKSVINAQRFDEIIPDTLWHALDTSGNFAGLVFHIFPQGYGGLIPITVGLDADGKITGIRIARPEEGLKETEGLGAKTANPEFTRQFIGKDAYEVLLKKHGGTIDAITGATISSRAVCDGVKKGIETYRRHLAVGYDKKQLFPEAQKFIEVIKDSLWYAVSDNDTLGIVFFGVTQGYLDLIKFAVGVTKDNKITGIDILYSHETEGLGEQIRNKEFLDKFKQAIPDAITGATISSRALINAVKLNLEKYQTYLK